MNTPSKEALEAAKELTIDRDNWKARAVDFDANLTNQKLEAAMDQLAKAEAHVKELEATCAELVTDGNALTLAANLAKQSQRAEQAEARVKELEVSNSELRESHAAIYLALATLEADCSKWPDQIRALRAAGEPAKHPDTERLDWLEIDPQARLAEIRRLIFTDRDTVREAIEAARKEAQK